MTEEETYIEKVFTRLAQHYDIELNDVKSVKQGIAECFFFGFTETNAVRWSRCTEEVNPDLDEDIALSRMKKISEEATTRNHNYKKAQVLPYPLNGDHSKKD